MNVSADPIVETTEPVTEALAAAHLPLLKLRRGEDRRIRAGHLWVYSNEVDTSVSPLASFSPGDRVRVHSDRDQFLGYATINPHALICARIFGRSPASPIDASLIRHRLKVALTLRNWLYTAPYYRLVFGESDGLPGLVIDRYGEVLVAQSGTAGIDALRAEIETAIVAELAPRALVWKNNGSARELEALPKQLLCTIGEMPIELQVQEGELRYSVPLASAQKTGWFYDQTSNRTQWQRMLRPGARVLDVCSYAGAWAISAMRAGAREAICIDASAPALESAQRNAAANGHAIGVRQGDAFDVLDELQRQGERFDAIVLDPPAFIKRRKDSPRGQAAYRKLNQLAMRLLERDALLVSCSCSFHLPADDFVGLIQAAARQTSRFVQILATGGQSPDHPMHPAIAESRYLKAYFCRVTRE